jgi:hypothetical protein
MFVAWINAPVPTARSSWGIFMTPNPANCTVTTVTVAPSVQTTQLDCSFYAWGLLTGSLLMDVEVRGTARNVGMAMRTFNPAVAMSGMSSTSATVTLNSDGSAAVVATGQVLTGSTLGLPAALGLCGIVGPPLTAFFNCRQYTVSVPISLFVDHPLLDSTNATWGWFVRNEWYRLLYYAVSRQETAFALPAPLGGPACTTGVNCLSVANVTPANAQRSILILAGRSINGSARPSGTLSDYLEFGNATSAFERQTISKAVDASLKRPFNDRVVVIDSN